MNDRLFPIRKQYSCFHYHVRKGVYCDANAAYVAEYSNGIGACEAHVGDLVKWCLADDRKSVQIHTREMWDWMVDKESQG